MLNKKHGFTLIEIVIAMAVYSILLVIMGITAVAFSELYSRVNDPSTINRKSVAMQEYITRLWQENNGTGSIDLSDETVLFIVDGVPVEFEDHSLIHDDRVVESHESIDDITITVDEKHVTFRILSEGEVLLTFINPNLGGNSL